MKLANHEYMTEEEFDNLLPYYKKFLEEDFVHELGVPEDHKGNTMQHWIRLNQGENAPTYQIDFDIETGKIKKIWKTGDSWTAGYIFPMSNVIEQEVSKASSRYEGTRSVLPVDALFEGSYGWIGDLAAKVVGAELKALKSKRSLKDPGTETRIEFRINPRRSLDEQVTHSERKRRI